MGRRVVITGAGIVSSLGNNIETFIENIKNGKNGISRIESFDVSNHKVKLAAEIKNFDGKDFGIDSPRKKDKFVQYAMAAAIQAKENASFAIDKNNQYRTGVIIGSGIGGLETIENEYEKYINKGSRRVSSHFIPKAIVNMAAGSVSIQLGTKGVCLSVVTACASGTDSIGQAFRMIRDGYQDAVFAGGCEAAICPMGIAGFESMSALSTSEDIERASIPFDKERSGFVMGEGASVILLESLESAKERGADIICELVGYGQSSDSYHITAPDPEAKSASLAMNMAISDAGIDKSKIDYINAHGTSTPLNDSVETKAIKSVFSEVLDNLSVSSTKSMTGHMLGAAGSTEAIICSYALKDSFVPATINYKMQDPECDLDYVTGGTRYKDIEFAMSNSLGFGGHNACIILKKYCE